MSRRCISALSPQGRMLPRGGSERWEIVSLLALPPATALLVSSFKAQAGTNPSIVRTARDNAREVRIADIEEEGLILGQVGQGCSAVEQVGMRT